MSLTVSRFALFKQLKLLRDKSNSSTLFDKTLLVSKFLPSFILELSRLMSGSDLNRLK